MKKTVEKEIRKILKYVAKETNGAADIEDFLIAAAEEVYDFDVDTGKPATCEHIINGLWNETDNFLAVWKENKAKGIE